MNSDIDKIGELTKALNASISAFLAGESRVNVATQQIKEFVAYLQGRYSQISKYKSVEAGIVEFLNGCDFKQKMNFDGIRHCCDALPAIEQKIATMSQMAGTMVNKRPDRYGLSVTVNDCVAFTRYCAERMSIGDADKAMTVASRLIGRLQQVIYSFQKEDATLQSINRLLKEQSRLLQSYPLYEKEIRTYLSGYPHGNNADIQYVKQHLADLATIDARFNALVQGVADISTYADRHDKRQVEQKARQFISAGHKNMVYSDLARANELITKLLGRINDVKNEFRQEERSVSEFYRELNAGTADIWTEDSAEICSYLKRIMDRGTCLSVFSMDDIMKKKSAAVEKKRRDIQDMIIKYPWLKRDKYRQQIDNLTGSGTSYRRFVGGVEDIKNGRSLFTKLYELIINI